MNVFVGSRVTENKKVVLKMRVKQVVTGRQWEIREQRIKDYMTRMDL